MARNVDLLIVGSGPVGATFARLVAEARPNTSILMVDLGPRMVEPREGNIYNYRSSVPVGQQTAEAGLQLLGSEALPEAAMASCVGGMGVFWGGATPRPGQTERASFIDDESWERGLTTAERLLRTRNDLFADSAGGRAIRETLADVFGSLLPQERPVHIQPGAYRSEPNGQLRVTDPDDILRPVRGLLAEHGHFELRPETLCRALQTVGDRITGAILEHRPSGTTETVAPRVVVVAGDSFRTPQLLWASGIRHAALGRHLMDHPRCSAEVALDPSVAPALTAAEEQRPVVSASCVPFAAPLHPFQGSIGHMSRTVAGRPAPSPAGSVVLVWMSRVWPRPENHVAFSDSERDWCGMPALSIEFALTEAEQTERERSFELLQMAASSLGQYLPGSEPSHHPLGSSLHYQGTVRMGEHDDGSSVCNPRSRVWGTRNLFVGGNGVIPSATTCNPTLTSVALASLAVDEVLSALD